MSGQLVDASIIAAPKQRHTRAEKQAIKEGRVPPGGLAGEAGQAALEGRRCALEREYHEGEVEGESPMVDLAIPEFGYQNQVSAAAATRSAAA